MGPDILRVDMCNDWTGTESFCRVGIKGQNACDINCPRASSLAQSSQPLSSQTMA